MKKHILIISIAVLLCIAPRVLASTGHPPGVMNGGTQVLASTLLGGSGEEGFHSVCVAVDENGDVFVAGVTDSPDFPTTVGAFDTSHNGDRDFFVSKFDSELESLIVSTYVGGSGRDFSLSIVLGEDGNVYFAGVTDSRDFPTTPDAYDTSGGADYDFVLFKLDGELSTLQASTYLGGSSRDTAARSFLALDGDGNVIVTGYTESNNFPTTQGSYDTSYNGRGDSIVSKFDPNLRELLASTYVGSTGNDWAYALAVGNSGVYFTGHTDSVSYPVTSGAYDESYNGGTDTFLTRLDGNLTRVEVSTYIGGSGFDNTATILVDEDGSVVIGGHTGSRNFPTTSESFSTVYGGGNRDIFLSRFDSDLDELLASTLLGGGGSDIQPHAIVGDEGGLYVSGRTDSASYPVTAGAFDEVSNGEGDYFLSNLEASLSSLLYSTFLGGSGDEQYGQISLSRDGAVIVSGSSSSRDFPVTAGSYDESYKGGRMDVFVLKMEVVPLTDGGEPHIVDGEDEGDFSIPGFSPISVALGALLGCTLFIFTQTRSTGNIGTSVG